MKRIAAAAAQDLFALVVLLLDERVRDPELAARVVAEADDVARPDVVAVDVLLGLRARCSPLYAIAATALHLHTIAAR